MEIIAQLTVNSLIAGSIYALLALGFNLIFGTVKFFDLGYGSLTAVGGYATFFFFRTLGLALIPSVFIGIAIASLVGFLTYTLLYRPLRKKKTSTMIYIVSSLGVLTVLQAFIAILFTSQFKTLSVSARANTFNLFGGIVTDVQILIFVTMVVVYGILFYVIEKTLFGKAIQAIGDDEEVAKIVGINTEKIVGKVFLIGSAIAGLGGILVGFDTGIEPTMGLALLLKGVVASIIGGIGSLTGGVLGAFLLGFVENFGIWQISGEWKDAIAFTLLILFLIFRPQGIIKK